MRSLFIILFSFFFILGYSQPPGYIPKKGFPYFLRDTKGRIIGADIAGAFSALAADTTSESLPQPPDTIQLSTTTVANPGDTSGLSNGVEAYWSFEEAAPPTAFDSAGSYDGTHQNTPTLQQAGISNFCYDFDRTSSEWIDYGASFYDVGTNDLTISFWVYPTDNQALYGGVLGCYGSTPYWWIRINDTRQLYCVVNFGSGNIWVHAGQLAANTWHHIVFRLDRDGDFTVHVNNVLHADQEDISSHSAVDLSNSNTFAVGAIGNWLSSDYVHDGRIDEILIANRLYSISEISELYDVGAGKFWPFGGAGGDSIRHRNNGYDPRADSVMTIINPIGEGRSTSRTDGTLFFAYNMADSAAYKDTTTYWPYLKDTTYIIETYTGLWPEDIWTEVPNYYTIFIDSSNKVPPIQDPGGFWDTIFSQNLEHRDAPIEYIMSLWEPDWDQHLDQHNPPFGRESNRRWPGWWAGQLQDSVVVDPLSDSKVMKFSWKDIIINGWAGIGPARGGDYFRVRFEDDYHEVYLSYNIMFRPGFDMTYGGKLPGLWGGDDLFPNSPYRPIYGEGFVCMLMWAQNPSYEGSCTFYSYHQNGSQSIYGSTQTWMEFQPEGENLNYYGNGMFYFDRSSPIWYNITLRIVCNTFTGSTPNYDGIYEGYINGKLIGQQSGLYLITYPDRNDEINQIEFAHFFGGSGPAQRDEWTYVDDVLVFTYDESVDVPRGNELSPPDRVLNLPGEHKWE